jgi:tetratricopeptide (TPR) repeat protein
MEGYCDYQLQEYNDAYINFTRLGETSLVHVSKFQYLILLGKVLADVGHLEDSIKSLEKSLEISESAKTQAEVMKKRAEIFLDLGHIYYEMAYKVIKSGFAKEIEYESDLLNSIKNFHEASIILKILDDYPRIIRVFELIASNYEILGKMEDAIENYEKALEFAKLSNDVLSRFKLLEKVINIYTEQDLHELIVRKIDTILYEVAPVAYLDLRTIAGFHRRLGESFIELGSDTEALSELIVALNLYNKFSDTVPELGSVYNKLIDIYQNKEDSTHVEYYKDKLMVVQDQIEKAARREKMEYKPLEVVGEFWFFTEDGTIIFSYTPKTNSTPRLLSNFLTAMDNFGSELELAQIKTIKIGLEYFSYYKEEGNPIFIIGRSDIKFDVEMIEKIIKKFFVKFFTNFRPLIKSFDGDTTKFDSFIKIVKDIEID